VTPISKALIIGGGIAGPTAAMALRKAGIDATVYEAHGPGAEHVGAGFNIATNGLDALAAIDALDATKGLGIPATHISMYNRKARLLGTVATGLPRPGAPDTTTFKRGELFGALAGEAASRGITTEYHRRLVRIEQSDRSVTAHFADGTRASGDVLIGGTHHLVRNPGRHFSVSRRTAFPEPAGGWLGSLCCSRLTSSPVRGSHHIKQTLNQALDIRSA
jgi:FAD-dependent urate hydroxylase